MVYKSPEDVLTNPKLAYNNLLKISFDNQQPPETIDSGFLLNSKDFVAKMRGHIRSENYYDMESNSGKPKIPESSIPDYKEYFSGADKIMKFTAINIGKAFTDNNIPQNKWYDLVNDDIGSKEAFKQVFRELHELKIPVTLPMQVNDKNDPAIALIPNTEVRKNNESGEFDVSRSQRGRYDAAAYFIKKGLLDEQDVMKSPMGLGNGAIYLEKALNDPKLQDIKRLDILPEPPHIDTEQKGRIR